ncbi:SIS domain-containing protein [Dongshaea marina]|uniref:SIS domain-containing protein n=1 Tax=Dongshaea marina TaxID=2047966 RepID=UPI00131F0839|nr:SIS domain-containing protein [Dongshaea marina]
MPCLTKIKQLMDSLSDNEQRIAHFIVQSSELVCKLSSVELAQRVKVSQSAIVKFCQKVGYRGFTDFRLDLSKGQGEAQQSWGDPSYVHNDIARGDSLAVIADKLMHEKMMALKLTHQLNRSDDVELAVDMLVESRSILLSGIGASWHVAEDLSQKLSKIGQRATCHQDLHAAFAALPHMDHQDLLLVISYRGEQRQLCQLAEQARKRRIPLLLITRCQPNPLRQYATRILFSVADESSFRSSSISSRTAQLALTDLLFMGVIQRDFEYASDLIRQSQQLLNELEL